VSTFTASEQRAFQGVDYAPDGKVSAVLTVAAAMDAAETGELTPLCRMLNRCSRWCATRT